MIELRRINQQVVFVNPDLIRLIEAKPDITLTFLNGDKLIVQNTPQEIIEKIIQFRNQLKGQL